jgi:hypothetical protein
MQTQQERIIDSFVDSLKEHFDAKAREGKKYVFKFFVKGEFYGYHQSTLGQVTTDVTRAKRYPAGKYQQSQLETIAENALSRLIRAKTGDWEGRDISKSIYETYWEGVDPDDLFIDFEYIPDDAEPHTFTFTKL